MIIISNDKVNLRDFLECDIEKRIYWETVEKDWQLWDGPWEYEGLTEEQLKINLERYIDNMHKWVDIYSSMPKEVKRTGFQIETNDSSRRYIGWCNSYNINNEYEYDVQGKLCAIGIDIPDVKERRRGYAFSALQLFIKYLLENGEQEIYTQTWSGNIRMINLANKLGFEECMRKINKITVRGKMYDGLTFKLNLNKFNEI